MSGNSTAYFGRLVNFEGGVTSLDPDAFSLGKNAAVNAKGVAYQYIAFASHADIKVGSYVGDDLDNRSISGIGFLPDLVWIKTEGGSAAVWRSSEMSGDSSALFDKGFAEEDLDNLTQSLESDGFQVGTHPSVNGSAANFHYVAFRAVPGSFAVGTYTGDGVDDRSIAGLGFQPDYVWVKVDAGFSSMVHRSANQEGDTTMRIVGAGNADDEIQALEVGGFQVGTGNPVNTDGDRYRYVAWKSARVAPTP